MKLRRTSLRASLNQLAQDFIGGVLRALRSASFTEIGQLQNPRAVPAETAPPISRPRPRAPVIDVLAKLTPRERDVFERILHGSRAVDLERDLGISRKTVQTHRAKVNQKLGVRSAAELVRFGARHGLLNAQGDDGVVDRVALPHRDAGAPFPVFDLADVERRTIAAALRVAKGNRERAAILLGKGTFEGEVQRDLSILGRWKEANADGTEPYEGAADST